MSCVVRCLVAGSLASLVLTAFFFLPQIYQPTILTMKIGMRNASTNGLPAALAGSFYHVALGCWHLKNDSHGSTARLHVSAEASFAAGPRWDEVQRAIALTHGSNPSIHYILVTKRLDAINLMNESPVLATVPHDIWFCPHTAYGTPIQIGNLYPGLKFACSIDNWLPKFDLECPFVNGQQNIVYVIQRADMKNFTGGDQSCSFYKQMGSADGILYEHVPDKLAVYLRFPRTYWGCENLALFVLQRGGVKLVNLCPAFSPIHVHKVEDRDPGRLRINAGANSVSQGSDLDLASFCKRSNASNHL